MSRKKFCIKRIGACVACLVLTINLMCTSCTRVQAAPVAAGYAIEEIVGALLVSLGITSATGEALDKAGLTPENARDIINSIYAGAKEFSHETDEIIDETIMNAITDAVDTGKIVFKQGSKAWEYLKSWAADAYSNIKNLTSDADTSLTLSGEYPTVEEWNNIYKNVVSAFYGISASNVNIPSAWSFDEICMGVHYVVIVAFGSQIAFYSVSEYIYSWGQKWTDEIDRIFLDSYLGSYGYDIAIDGTAVDRREAHSAISGVTVNNPAEPVTGVKILWTNVCYPWQRVLGVPIPGISQPLPRDDAYDKAYNPAIPGTTDVVTPGNTITEEEDGTKTVAGDYVIDVALPVAFPIDLTKGIVIGKDVPVEDVMEKTGTDDKTDDKEDDKNKPVTPDIPDTDVGAGLVADLKSIFPFCIPFDLIACIKGLAAEGEPPKWVMRIPMPLDYTWVITVDMADFEGVVKVLRVGEDVLFIIGLIMITRSLMIRG